LNYWASLILSTDKEVRPFCFLIIFLLLWFNRDFWRSSLVYKRVAE